MNVTSATLFGLIFAFISAISCSAQSSDEKERDDSASFTKFHVFLLIGQSNMAGRAPIPALLDQEIPHSRLWNGKEWEPAKPGLNRYSTYKKDVIQGINPGLEFIHAYREAFPDVTVGIVCQARGGTSIQKWAEDVPGPMDLYQNAIRMTQAALASATKSNANPVLQGVLWHQGESNSSNHAMYPDKLEGLIVALRRDLTSPDLPVVYSQLGNWNPKYAEFNQMISKQPKKIIGTACVSSASAKNLDTEHFNADGQKVLGRRYAQAIQSLLK